MFDWVPAQGWLLIAIAVVAYAPARTVYRYFVAAPARRNITPRTEPARPRLSGVGGNLILLAALGAAALFILTPAATRLASEPLFWPLVMAALGAGAIVSVWRSCATGSVRPFLNGFESVYDRQEQPLRFRASITLNILFGCFLLWVAFDLIRAAPIEALEQRCFDADDRDGARAAIDACARLIGRQGSRDPYTGSLFAARGRAHFLLGDLKRAAADYGEAIRIDPNDSASHYNLGLVDEAYGDVGLAIDDFGAALRADPDNADAWLHRGLNQAILFKQDAAIADFSAAYRLAPDNMTALANRGLAYAMGGNGARALRDFDVVRARDPANPTLLAGEIVLTLQRRDYADAVRRLDERLRLRPDDAWALAMRASAYAKLEQDGPVPADIQATRGAAQRQPH